MFHFRFLKIHRITDILRQDIKIKGKICIIPNEVGYQMRRNFPNLLCIVYDPREKCENSLRPSD